MDSPKVPPNLREVVNILSNKGQLTREEFDTLARKQGIFFPESPLSILIRSGFVRVTVGKSDEADKLEWVSDSGLPNLLAILLENSG